MDADPDSDPTIFFSDLQDANKKLIKKKTFSAYYFLKGTYIYNIFQRYKVQKKSQKVVIKIYLTIFAWW